VGIPLALIAFVVLVLFVFRAHRLLLTLERGHDGVPGEDRAFDARGIFVNAREHRQLAHVADDFAGHDHVVDLAEHFFHVGLGFTFGKICEQRRRSFRDATTRPDEARVLDHVAVQREKQFQLVAAERVVTLRGTGGLRQLVEVARLLAVVKDDLLIKIV
jgi:hypothetical protein